MIVYAPGGLESDRPLVISLHGMNQDAPYQQNMAKWELVADTAQFVVVYPSGLNKSWDISGTTDTDFILAIIDEMYGKYKIDKNRVYLTGFSMGGMMTYHAANTIADKIAAFGPVSGYMSTEYKSSRPIPIIHTHGTADDVVPHDAGNSGMTGAFFPGCEAIAKGWAERNGCDAAPVTTTPYPVGTSNSNVKKVWKNGECETEVVLISINGKGHWHSNDPAGVYTTTEIWNFVRNYTLDCGKLSAFSVSIVTPQDNENFVAPATVAVDVEVSEGVTLERVDYLVNDEVVQSDNLAPYNFDISNLDAGVYEVKAVAYTGDGKTAEDVVTVKVNAPQAPFNGVPHEIPGTIELEEYDIGGNGFAYYDTSVGNEGGADFRMDEDVDIEDCSDTDGGYNLGWTMAGEWTEYTVDVKKSGTYELKFRVSCNGDDRTVTLESDGQVIADDIAIPNTEGWQEWADVVVEGVELQAGEQVLKLTIGATDYVNLNYMQFVFSGSANDPVLLKKGWNLVGCPISGSTPVADALASVWELVEVVKDFDGFYDKANPEALNSLKQMKWSGGYFVKVSADCELSW